MTVRLTIAWVACFLAFLPAHLFAAGFSLTP